MKLLIVSSLLLVSFSVLADSSQEESDMKAFNDAIVNARFAGTCAAYKQMADFQTATQMPGGDEFINRFGATEVARLGMTIPEFTALCEKAINNYNTMNRMSQ
ncbi:hypothetical protein LPW36_04760 [Jinshanibacter sp. LJY008]|uniref:Uncharacterized protein n=1 Tax=Limnobaculum eriocheiris TaxID=2897391 RepID=A0A9X1MTL8_9GAMM|nr:hypothetical protein [Limnobaculum eriocheiris]MCD1125341.1 hypothetical protein [Limnobaculum eriocheiris]